MTSDISIIIPTLNEQHNLAALKHVAEQVTEIIVVDGGSSDATVNTAEELGFPVFEKKGPGGRGAQLNLGAAQARSDNLLFLHCDTRLPADFPEAILSCLATLGVALGAFSLTVDQKGWALNTITRWANIRSRILQLPYGDQAFFIRKDTFERSGGFPEVPIMEDFMMVKKIKRFGRVKTLPQTVVTSARRWQKLGPFRTTCVNQLMVLGYYLGVPSERLAAFYRNRK